MLVGNTYNRVTTNAYSLPVCLICNIEAGKALCN